MRARSASPSYGVGHRSHPMRTFNRAYNRPEDYDDLFRRSARGQGSRVEGGVSVYGNHGPHEDDGELFGSARDGGDQGRGNPPGMAGGAWGGGPRDRAVPTSSVDHASAAHRHLGLPFDSLHDSHDAPRSPARHGDRSRSPLERGLKMEGPPSQRGRRGRARPFAPGYDEATGISGISGIGRELLLVGPDYRGRSRSPGRGDGVLPGGEFGRSPSYGNFRASQGSTARSGGLNQAYGTPEVISPEPPSWLAGWLAGSGLVPRERASRLVW